MTKYARSLHAPISLGTTSDDRLMPRGFLAHFVNQDLVVTEKLDGQNNCFSQHGLFARSHAAPTQHAWDKPLIQRWQLIKNDLQDLEIFGENMYGIHSIAYSQLESYFYVFAVRQNGVWLSWEEVKFYAQLFDFPTVPEMPIQSALTDEFCARYRDENQALTAWLANLLGMDWQDYTQTAGQLGGFDPQTHVPCCEGLVVRKAASFTTNQGDLPVQDNEFSDLFKLVRAKHVQTDVHWSKTWQAAKLVDYQKFAWFGFEF